MNRSRPANPPISAVVVAEPPHAQRRPGQVLHRVAGRQRALPVEDRAQAVLADDQVAVAGVAVDDRLPRRRIGEPPFEPLQAELQAGRRSGISSIWARSPARAATAGGPSNSRRAQRHRDRRRIDRVQPGQRLAELADDGLAVALLLDEAQHAPGHGLAGHELGDHERPADEVAVGRARGGRGARRRRASRPRRGRRPRRRSPLMIVSPNGTIVATRWWVVAAGRGLEQHVVAAGAGRRLRQVADGDLLAPRLDR